MSHPLQLLLLLSIVIAAAKLAGAASTRFGLPAVLGELLIGLILGETALDILAWPAFAAPGAPLLALVTDLADVGVVLLMLVAGLETDIDEMKAVGAAAFWSAAGGVLLPLVGGVAIAAAFGMPVFWTGLFIGTILTTTSVSISAQVLMELGVLKSKEGSAILGAAVIDDVLGIILLSVVVAFAQAADGVSVLQVALIVGRMALFFAAAIVAGRYFGAVLGWADRLGVSEGLLATVTAIAFIYGWAAEYLGGVAAITGAYLAGVMFSRTRFSKRVAAGVHPLTYSILVPVFFISIGLRANARDLGGQALFAVAMIVVAIAGKILGCGVLARLCGLSPVQSVRVGVGMIARGEVGLIVAGTGLSAGVISQDLFSACVVMVLVTTMVTPPLLRLTYPGGSHGPHIALEEAFTAVPDDVHADHADS